MKGTLEERFWAKVQKANGCWLWDASRDPQGYGQLGAGGHRGRPLKAHRVSYELANGPIPNGMEVDHMCHERACVNPAHLRLATRKQNTENRAGAYGRSGVRGVVWSVRAKKWMARVGHEGKTYYVGIYDDIREAEASVIAKRNELFTHNIERSHRSG